MNDPIAYGTHDVESLANLWPDPTDAPHVPTENILRTFLSNPEDLEPDLRNQLETCSLVKRALDLLEHNDAQPPSGTSMPEGLAFPKAEIPSTAPLSSISPEQGSLCSTSNHLPYWDGERAHTRITFMASQVLLLEKYEPEEDQPDAWRAAPVTPLFTVPEHLIDEETTVFKNSSGMEYVVWIDLARPVLDDQIDQVIDAECLPLETLQELADTLLDPRERSELAKFDSDLSLFWNQEQARARQLDAQREFDEEMCEYWLNPELHGVNRETQDEAFQICEEVVPQAMAAATDGVVRHRLTFLDDNPTGCHCELVGNAYADKGNTLKAEWKISDAPDKLLPGMPFFLVRKNADEPSGCGLVHRSGDGLAAQLIGGEGTIASDLENSPDDFLLLCRPPSY